MQFSQQNLNRLASLSVFGAGILTIAAPSADAGVIVTSPDVTVGFSGGALNFYAMNLPGTHDLFMERTSSTSSHTYRVRFRGGSSNFATAGADRLRAFPAGVGWSVVGAAKSSFGFAATDFDGTDVTQMTSTNRYFLFRFADTTAGNALRYGWGELAVSFSGSKPDVELLEYAYDDAGAQIQTGDTGAPAVPEPSPLALTGLGALAIGARGLRRWRASRQAA